MSVSEVIPGSSRARRSLVRAMLVLAFAFSVHTPAFATSAWAPTLLVNTEAFQTIDDTDSSSNISVKFGGTLNKNLTYVRTTSRFQFDAPLYVQGSLGVTGSMSGNALYVQRAFSGAGLTGCSNGTNDKLLWDSATQRFSCGSDQGGAGSGISQTDADARYVNTSGDTMTGTLTIRNAGGINASGTILTNGDLTLNSDNGATDAVLTFGNATLAQAITYSHANQRFEFSKNVSVTGNIRATGNLSGATLNVTGTSGNTFVLDGNSVVFDATNNRFGIGTAAPDATLEVVGVSSGRILRAMDSLESSGSLVVRGTVTLKPSATQTISAAGNSILANAGVVKIDPTGNVTLTSTPTIADGVAGQTVTIVADNAETNKVILQDQDTLGSSNLQLGTTLREITAKKALTLMYDGTDWVETAYTTESVDVQTFTGNGTWTKPTGAKAVYVICVGAGGGGGGGTGGAAGTARIGGGGGGGGARGDMWFTASDLSATESVTVGTGGTGGNGNAGASGSNGTAGGNSSFGTYLTCYGGGYGKGGVAAAISAGGGGGGTGGAGSNGAAATNLGGLPAATAGANGVSGQGGGGNIGTNNGQAEYGGGGGNGSSATPGAAGTGGGSLYGAGGGGGGGGITTGNAA